MNSLLKRIKELERVLIPKLIPVKSDNGIEYITINEAKELALKQIEERL